MADYQPTTTKLLDNGQDGQKLVFAILGDGYAAGEQATFASDVKTLVTDGLLGNDFYRANQQAFNVYRVDLISNDSGVSQRRYNDNGTVSDNPKDTALKIIYSGDWNHCWMEESPDTDVLVHTALSAIAKYDYVLVVLNEPRFGGCARGSRLSVTSGSGWHTAAHEYGHGIGGLFDEYWTAGTTYTGDPINTHNSSTELDRNQVVWRDLIESTTPIPTILAAGMDANQTVGIFEGCNYDEKLIYRPVDDCRMREIDHVFCPVCTREMNVAVSPYLGGVLRERQQLQGDKIVYLHLVIRVTRTGAVDVLKASEVPGDVVLRTHPTSDFVYEIQSGGVTVAMESLTTHPFLARSVIDPKEKLGHHFGNTDSATIVVKVPSMTAEKLRTDGITFRIHEVRRGDLKEAFSFALPKTPDGLMPYLEVASADLTPKVLEKLQTAH